MSSSGGLGSLSRANRGGPSGVDGAALGLGHVRSTRIRRRPLVPSWVLKVIMAITGVLFALFVLVHMIGNLKVFTGAESFNTYAHWLRTVLQPFLPYEGLFSTQRHRPKESDCADEERDYSHDGGAKLPAQGGINAARDNTADNDSLRRFVIDTVKGGDFRGREADAFRLAEESMRVVDHLNAIGAPFAREYGGTLATRSFGGVQVSRTFYARGQTGQQLRWPAPKHCNDRSTPGPSRCASATKCWTSSWTRAAWVGSSCAISSPVTSPPTRRTPSYCARAATATSSSTRRWRRTPTPPPSGGRPSAARTSRRRHSSSFTRRRCRSAPPGSPRPS